MAKKVKLILEITEDGLRFLWIKFPLIWRHSKPVQILRYDSVPSASNSIGQVVKQYLLSLPPSFTSSSYPISTLLLLPFSNGFLREFRVPPLSGYKLGQTIKYLLEEEVPLPSEDRTYDFVKLSDGKVLIGAIRRTTLDDIVEELKTARIRVIRADFAISGITPLLSLTNQDVALFIGHQKDTLNLGVFRGNSPVFFQTHNTINANWEQEVFRQIRYYQTDHLYVPIKRIVAEGKTAQELAKRLVNTGIGEAWSISTEAQFEGVPSPMESFITGKDKGLNLLRENNLEDKLRLARRTVLAMTLAGLVMGMLFSWRVYSQVSESRQSLNHLETELNRVEQRVSQDMKKWEEWKRIKEESEKLGEQISNLLALIPSDIKVKEVELTESTLYFAGSATWGNEVQGLMAELKRSGWTELALLRFSQQSEGEIQFVISSAKNKRR